MIWRSGATISLKRVSSILAVSLLAFASLTIAMPSQADWFDRNPAVVTDKDVYLVGETVRINVTCYIGMEFTSGKQCYFVVENSLDDVVYNMSRHGYWVLVFTFLSPPKTFSFAWNQKNDTGVQVPAGTYEIWGYEAGYQMSDPPIAGNSTAITIESPTSTESVKKADVNLVQGWYLFSLPLLASNYTSSSLGLPTGSVVARWNSATGFYDAYIVGVSPPSSAFALADFRAYFIYAASACTVSIFGLQVTSPQTFQWNLPPWGSGWVLAAFPNTGTVHYANEIQGWIDTPGVKVVTVVHYNPITRGYVTWISSIPTINNFPLLPGEGYGIYLAGTSSVVNVTYGP